MSQHPHGHPPPYYTHRHYPPAPPGSNIAYVPAPVMMPVYPPAPEYGGPGHPTYVTNHYYQTPAPIPNAAPLPLPVQEPIDWVSATPHDAAKYTGRALVAGKEGWDGSPLWIIRAHHSGEFIPGKLAIKHKSAYVAHGGKEVPVHNFDILLAQPHHVSWLPHSRGQVPVGAIAAGNTHTGEPLYIGRVPHRKSITPGKIHPSHQCCYISFGGEEIPFKHYEVLCKVIG